VSEIREPIRRPNSVRRTYRVRCAGCRREYVTTQPKGNIERLACCQACRPPSRRRAA
jgi:hypothetical protein